MLAVEFSFSLVDAALLSAAVAFAVFEVWGLERFAARRTASSRAITASHALVARAAPAANVDGDVARSEVAGAAERAPFEALGEMYPLLTARAARVLEDRFGYSGPGTAPTLPSGEAPQRWRAIAETLEVADPGAEEPAARRARRDVSEDLEAEPLPPELDAVLLASGHDPPVVRWAAAVALVLAVLLLLLIL